MSTLTTTPALLRMQRYAAGWSAAEIAAAERSSEAMVVLWALEQPRVHHRAQPPIRVVARGYPYAVAVLLHDGRVRFCGHVHQDQTAARKCALRIWRQWRGHPSPVRGMVARFEVRDTTPRRKR